MLTKNDLKPLEYQRMETSIDYAQNCLGSLTMPKKNELEVKTLSFDLGDYRLMNKLIKTFTETALTALKNVHQQKLDSRNFQSKRLCESVKTTAGEAAIGGHGIFMLTTAKSTQVYSFSLLALLAFFRGQYLYNYGLVAQEKKIMQDEQALQLAQIREVGSKLRVLCCKFQATRMTNAFDHMQTEFRIMRSFMQSFNSNQIQNIPQRPELEAGPSNRQNSEYSSVIGADYYQQIAPSETSEDFEHVENAQSEPLPVSRGIQNAPSSSTDRANALLDILELDPR